MNPEPEPCDACAFTDTHCGECEQWRGLHNPERHQAYTGESVYMPYAECRPEWGGCMSECGIDDLCRCCLTAEVKALRERIASAEAVIRVCSFITPTHTPNDDGVEVGGLEVVPVANVLAALDGDA